MSKKYLYLLGAGASANSLPTVADMNPENIPNFQDGMCPNEMQSVFHIGKLVERLANSMSTSILHTCAANLIYLYALFQEHEDFTIDNICRYYYFQGRDTYDQIKIATTQYFNLVEALRPVDVRYRIFLMNLLSNEKKLPHNINILSWNYDRQLSMTFEELNPIEPIIFDTDLFPISQQNFCEIKLNGTFSPQRIDRLSRISTVTQFVNHYKRLHPTNHPIVKLVDIGETRIKFGWEGDLQLETYKNLIQSYDELIIIGYSFPFYNRSIDNYILKSFASKKGQRVIVQDRNPDDIIEKIEAVVGKGKIEFIKMKPTQFYIPEYLEYPEKK